MNIVFCGDLQYLYQLPTVINSIILNTKSSLKITIITDNSDVVMKSKIFLFVENYFCINLQIKYINGNIFRGVIKNKKISESAYYRILIPDLLNNLDKVIYLDLDIIVCMDIKLLFDKKFNNEYLFAVEDNWVSSEIKNKIGLLPNDKYFNSGVILFNIAALRSTQLVEEMVFFANNSRDYTYHDQCVLNKFMKNYWTPLDSKFNYMSQNFIKINENLDSKIIHFNNYFGKPWNYFCFHPMLHKYMIYSKINPFFKRKFSIIDMLNFLRRRFFK